MPAILILVVMIFLIYFAVVYVLPITVAYAASMTAGKLAAFSEADKKKVFWRFYFGTGAVFGSVILLSSPANPIEALFAGAFAAFVWPFGWSAAMLGLFDSDFENGSLLFVLKISPLLGYIFTLAYTVYAVTKRTSDALDEEL